MADNNLQDRIISELAVEAARLALEIDKDGRHLKDIAQYTRLVVETVSRYYHDSGEVGKWHAGDI